MSDQEVENMLNETKAILLSLNGASFTDPGTQEKIVAIRKFTCTEHKPPLPQIIASGICPLLIQQMDLSTQSVFIFEVLWILSNVASGNTQETQYVNTIGGIDVFLKYVQYADEDVMSQALWGLGNIVGDNVSFRNLVLSKNAVSIVLKQLQRKNLQLKNQQTICWVISNFARGSPMPSYELVRPCMPYFIRIMQQYPTDDEIWCDSMWGLNYLTGQDEGIDDIIAPDRLSVICNKLKSITENSAVIPTKILSPLVRIIANISTSEEDAHLDALIENGIIPVLVHLSVNNTLKGIQKEVLRTISNIAAGTNEQLDSIVECENFYENMMKVYNQPNVSLQVQNEVLYVLGNSLGKKKPIPFFLEKGVVNFLFTALEKHKEASSLQVVLEGMEQMIENVNELNIHVEDLDGKCAYLKNVFAKKVPKSCQYRLKKVYANLVKYLKNQSTFESIADQLGDLELDMKSDSDESAEVEEEDAGAGAGAGAGAPPAAPGPCDEEGNDDDDLDEEDDDDDDDDGDDDVDEEEGSAEIEIENFGGSAAPPG